MNVRVVVGLVSVTLLVGLLVTGVSAESLDKAYWLQSMMLVFRSSYNSTLQNSTTY